MLKRFINYAILPALLLVFGTVLVAPKVYADDPVYTLSGTVTNVDGDKLANLFVAAESQTTGQIYTAYINYGGGTDYSNPAQPRLTGYDLPGTYTLELPVDTYTVTIGNNTADTIWQNQVFSSVNITGNEQLNTTLTANAPHYTLSGILTDANGAALPNTLVHVYAQNSPDVITETDNTGAYSFSLPSGVAYGWSLGINGEDSNPAGFPAQYAVYPTDAHFAMDQDTTYSYTLTAFVDRQIQVVDVNGDPLAGVPVYSMGNTVDYGVTDANGYVSIKEFATTGSAYVAAVLDSGNTVLGQYADFENGGPVTVIQKPAPYVPEPSPEDEPGDVPPTETDGE